MQTIPYRNRLVYALLVVLWVVFLCWQTVEHNRVRLSARTALINRAKDISNTLGLVMRSQRRFGGIISRERMESALKDLIKPGELNAIVLLNAAGEVVASAGNPVNIQPEIAFQQGEHWATHSVTLMNPIDLGTNVTQEQDGPRPTIVVPRRELFGASDTNRVAASQSVTNGLTSTNRGDRSRSRRPSSWPRSRGTNDTGTNSGRHFGMKDEEYLSVLQKQGVHSFVIVMSTQSLETIFRQDLWLRAIIGVLATISVLGSGLAWRNLIMSSELQMRLVRASELNSHLREMNLAAAGLAHETRNPLNIVRGLAQMISRQEEATADVRRQSREIINETDRVTAQLNEFINYSRPREVRRSAVPLASVVEELVRTLHYDIEEKKIQVENSAQPLSIEADEQLLRQALFNLLLNSIQAAESGGKIEIVAGKENPAEAFLEIRDNGPGVPPDQRKEIFKPYFTTNKKGTGLGLAVVQQIVLAHGWEIECRSNQPAGAVFRMTHLKVSTAS